MKHEPGLADGVETIERLATFRVLALTVAALAAVVPLGTYLTRRATIDINDSMGSVNLADEHGLGVDGSLELTLEPPPDQGLFYTVYRVVKGDTISEIAASYGVTTDSIVTFNGITNARTLSIGKYLKVPSLNGILYSAKEGDTAASLAEAYGISADRIKELNNLDDEPVSKGHKLFLPDARLSSWVLREISGDLFSWPVRGWVTSWYGWRNDPFTGARAFHTGIDIGAAHGSSVRAAMEGRVSQTGYSAILGNFVMLTHHSGYSTVYAHLSAILVRTGSRVAMGAAIGRVGSTGYSTGPHLHFTIRKNGQTINPMTMLR